MLRVKEGQPKKHTKKELNPSCQPSYLGHLEMSSLGGGWVTEKAVHAKPGDGLPKRYHRRTDWLDNNNAEIKILGALFGIKTQVTAPLIPKEYENVSVVPPNMTLCKIIQIYKR